MKTDKQTDLFTEFKLNSHLTLKNKIVMAPMTRVKATSDFVPTLDMAAYYSRRADAGLIITEGTIISDDALGHHCVPGIFNHTQVKAWGKVTDAVHKRQGVIFSQLWHVGRVSHPHFLQGRLPISASETQMKGKISRMQDLSYGKSRAATQSEIQEILSHYANAAKNAIAAGFDGVEIHGANGYLIDQFLHHDTNLREDEYGGSVQNRIRFALEVIRACGEMISYDRVGIRLSPGAYLNEISGDMRDGAVFESLLKQLNAFPLAYVHTGNFDDTQIFKELNDMTMTAFIRTHYQGTVIACGGYTFERAQDGIKNGDFNLVAMGRPFIANVDLIARLKDQEELKNYDVNMLQWLY